MTRAAQIDRFLDRTGWSAAERVPLAGDASRRRYLRLRRGAETAVLMDAPPGSGEEIGPFCTVADELDRRGLAPPERLCADPALGLLLLEDLGDDLFARVLDREPDAELRLYTAAIEALATLQARPAPADWPRATVSAQTELALLAYDWYAPAADPAEARAELSRLLGLLPAGDVPVLRDFHAENLVWLPGRAGVARVGLLDFQDAWAGHPGYDLVSLLQDARRDVSPATAATTFARFAQVTGRDPAAFAAETAILGAQRNLRILGVFARLSLHFGKPAYVDLVPRVWRHLMACLEHPALDRLSRILMRDLPSPEPAVLKDLKNRCATVPAP